MNRDDFIDVSEGVKATTADTVNQATEVAQFVDAETQAPKTEATTAATATSQATSEPILPKLDHYVNQQVKANPSLSTTLLKIAGVADIVFAVLQFLGALLLFLASAFVGSFLLGLLEGLQEGSVSISLLHHFGSVIFIALAVIACVGGGLNLWFGIRALRDRNVPGKAGFLFVAGIVQTVFSVLSLIMGNVTLFSLTGAAVSICYLVGAYLKRQAEHQA